VAGVIGGNQMKKEGGNGAWRQCQYENMLSAKIERKWLAGGSINVSEKAKISLAVKMWRNQCAQRAQNKKRSDATAQRGKRNIGAI
jgi:hypothetical protein